MKGFIHTINRLPPALTFGGTIIDDMRSGWHVAREIDHVLLGSKTWPYSDKDAMVIYDGVNPHITTFLDLPVSVQREMLSTALRVGECLWDENKEWIVSGRELLLVGTNMWLKPAPRMIQTIANPHFHTTIFPQYNQGDGVDIWNLQRISTWDYRDDGKWGKFATQVVDIDSFSIEHQRIFCIRPNNLLFRAWFMESMKWWSESNIFTLDTPLMDQEDIFTSEKNMKQFHEIYNRALQYIKSVTIVWTRDNRGFGISFVYDTMHKSWNIRLAFMEKNDSQDNGSICESSGHSIIRKVVDNHTKILGTSPFVNGLARKLEQI